MKELHIEESVGRSSHQTPESSQHPRTLAGSLTPGAFLDVRLCGTRYTAGRSCPWGRTSRERGDARPFCIAHKERGPRPCGSGPPLTPERFSRRIPR